MPTLQGGQAKPVGGLMTVLVLSPVVTLVRIFVMLYVWRRFHVVLYPELDEYVIGPVA
jgi:hypothetical protein